MQKNCASPLGVSEFTADKEGNAMTWSARIFEKWHTELHDPVKRRRAWDSLSNAQQKEVQELRVFFGFQRAARLDVDPRTIETRKPPKPDIYREISGRGRYFELGMVTDQDMAECIANAQKDGLTIASGRASQMIPMERMIFQKCGKRPTVHSLPADIVLYFSPPNMVPFRPTLDALLMGHRERIGAALTASPFSRIWFYDGWGEVILAVIEP